VKKGSGIEEKQTSNLDSLKTGKSSSVGKKTESLQYLETESTLLGENINNNVS